MGTLSMSRYWNGDIEYEHVLEWGHYRGLSMSRYWNGDIEYEQVLEWGH